MGMFESVVDNDREEARDARHYDRSRYRRVGDRMVDVDELPDPEDVES